MSSIFLECLKDKMVKDKLLNMNDIHSIRKTLQSNILSIEFKKADGSIRKFEKITTRPSLLPEHIAKYDKNGDLIVKKLNNDTVKFYVMELNAWRSARFDSIISLEIWKE